MRNFKPIWQQHLNRKIMECLNNIFFYDIKNEHLKPVIISDVDFTNDFKTAKAYYRCLKTDHNTIHHLNASKAFLRSQLAKKLALKRVPELTFIQDDSTNQGQRVDDVIKNINQRVNYWSVLVDDVLAERQINSLSPANLIVPNNHWELHQQTNPENALNDYLLFCEPESLISFIEANPDVNLNRIFFKCQSDWKIVLTTLTSKIDLSQIIFYPTDPSFTFSYHDLMAFDLRKIVIPFAKLKSQAWTGTWNNNIDFKYYLLINNDLSLEEWLDCRQHQINNFIFTNLAHEQISFLIKNYNNAILNNINV